MQCVYRQQVTTSAAYVRVLHFALVARNVQAGGFARGVRARVAATPGGKTDFLNEQILFVSRNKFKLSNKIKGTSVNGGEFIKNS
jgi:hypothetical protein